MKKCAKDIKGGGGSKFFLPRFLTGKLLQDYRKSLNFLVDYLSKSDILVFRVSDPDPDPYLDPH